MEIHQNPRKEIEKGGPYKNEADTMDRKVDKLG